MEVLSDVNCDRVMGVENDCEVLETNDGVIESFVSTVSSSVVVVEEF